MDNFYNILLDGKKFTLSKASIYAFPNFLIKKIIEKTVVDPNIEVEGNNIFLNKDPKSFSFIVDILRGYPFDINKVDDIYLKSKIECDLKYFGMIKVADNGLDTSILKTGDKESISSFFKNMENRLKDDMFGVINSISNDTTIKEMINGFVNDQTDQESDLESLDLEIDEEDEQNDKVTDVYTIMDGGQKLVNKLFNF